MKFYIPVTIDFVNYLKEVKVRDKNNTGGDNRLHHLDNDGILVLNIMQMSLTPSEGDGGMKPAASAYTLDNGDDVLSLLNGTTYSGTDGYIELSSPIVYSEDDIFKIVINVKGMTDTLYYGVRDIADNIMLYTVYGLEGVKHAFTLENKYIRPGGTLLLNGEPIKTHKLSSGIPDTNISYSVGKQVKTDTLNSIKQLTSVIKSHQNPDMTLVDNKLKSLVAELNIMINLKD